VLDESRSQLGRLGLTTDIDTAASLRDTTNVQIALLMAGVACARALTGDHGLIPQFVAGHSVGTFSAAVAAGVISLSEALEAVALRGHLMKEACADGDWGMAALTGPPTRSACQIAQEVATDDDPLWVANINSATQTVLSGTALALQKTADAAKIAGAINYERIEVSVASHGPKQAATARRLETHLAGLPRREPTARYVTNTRERATTSAKTVLDDLAQAVAHTVQWYDATKADGRTRRHLRHRNPARSRPHPTPTVGRAHGHRDLTTGHRSCGCHPTGNAPFECHGQFADPYRVAAPSAEIEAFRM
jgi:malonyl CoA-acyl carrier protein transacylase